MTEADLLKAAEDTDEAVALERRCEASFYAGSIRLLDGDKAGAAELLQKCVDTKRSTSAEHASAAAELDALKKGK